MKFILLTLTLLTTLFSEQIIFPISKTEFVIQNDYKETLVDLTGKDFIVISLREHGADGRVYAIDRDGVPWLTGIISSGARGYRTPTGVHSIKYRKRFHMSTVYPDASGINNMDWSLYFTNTGHALHLGNINSMSHGCIHVSYNKIRSIWNWAPNGTPIVVLRESYMDFVRHEL